MKESLKNDGVMEEKENGIERACDFVREKEVVFEKDP